MNDSTAPESDTTDTPAQPGDSLDGNAAAGDFMNVFIGDVTTATITCGGCGAIQAFGQLHAYLHAPGTVLRCRECTSMVARVATTDDRIWLDLSGSTSWAFIRA
jgi:hypothetical protein